MRVVIIGAGEVGFNTAKLLSEENHDVILIEAQESVRRRCEAQLDLLTILGNGASPRVLKDAGIDKADLFIAVTDGDEINILASDIVSRYDVPTRIARVSDPDYFMDTASIRPEEFGIDLVINPESLCAEEFYRLLKTADARELVEFADERVRLVGFRVRESMPIQGKPLIELRESGLVSSVRFVAIGRAGRTLIPRGSDKALPNDELYVIGARPAIKSFFTQIGIELDRKLERIVIAGAGRVAQYLAQKLQEDGTHVRIIESDPELAENAKALLRRPLVLYGEATDQALLIEAGTASADAFVALTGDDEDNLISCVFVSRLYEHVPTFTLVQKPRYVPIVAQMRSIDAAVSPQLAAVNRILRYVRRGRIVSVASLREIDAEVIEFVVEPNARVAGQILEQVDFPPHAIIGALVRDDEVIVPTGQIRLESSDRAIVFSLPESIPAIERLFGKR